MSELNDEKVKFYDKEYFGIILGIIISFAFILLLFSREIYKRMNTVELVNTTDIHVGDVYKVKGYTYEDLPIYITNDIESGIIKRVYVPISVDINNQKWYTYGVLEEFDGSITRYMDTDDGLLVYNPASYSSQDDRYKALMKTKELQNSMHTYKIVEVIESMTANSYFKTWCTENNIDTNYVLAYGLR